MAIFAKSQVKLRQTGIIVVLSGVLTAPAVWADQPAETHLHKGDEQMASDHATLWMACRFQPQSEIAPGFCAKLRADFTQTVARSLSETEFAPEGAEVAFVTIAPQSSHRAMVTLTVGRQEQGQFVQVATQQMRLGSVDSAIKAGSAAALVYPLAKLLEKLR